MYAVMILGVYAAVLYLRHSFQVSDVQILLAGVLILIELMLVIAIALLFSTFSTPALSALFAFCLYVIGHFNTDIREYGVSSDSWVTKVVASAMYYLLPNFGNFDIISRTAHGQFITSQHLSLRGRLRADLFAWAAAHRDVDFPKTRLQMNTVLLVLLLLAGTGVYWTQKAIDVRVGQFRSTEEVLYLPSGKVIKTLSLGHNGLLADVYWMRAVQYYGGKRLKNEKRFDLLDPLIGIATTLDPQLIHAYRFGAIFLSERSPVGAEQPEKALALLKQGIEQNPDEWQLYRDLGFVYYWYLQDYKKGAEAFLEGSKNPKSAAWMKTFAAELMAKGGSRESARFLWQQFYDTADNEQMKRNARENLLRLQALDEMDILRDFISKIEARLGRPVESIEELVKLGLLKHHPLDPKGFTYIYNPQTRSVQLSPDSTVRRF